MNTQDESPQPSREPEPEAPPIAFQDRLVLVMFLTVGVVFGVYLLVDLFFGFFR